MSNENHGSEAQGLDAAQTRTPSLAELLSVSQEEHTTALAAESAAQSATRPELQPEAPSAQASDLTLVEDEETPDQAQGSALDTQARESVATTTPEPSTTSTKRAMHPVLPMAGLGLAALGAALVVAPMVSSAAAQWLANHAELRSQSGTLLLAGLCMFGVAILLRSMREMRGTLDQVSAESQRIEGIAAGGQRVFVTLDQVRLEHMVLAREVVHLQGKLRRLIDIVSNPDYTASIYRLAASVDQLGKEVDSSMKGRFDDLQLQLATVAQHADKAEQKLAADLGSIPALMKEQHDAQQQAVKKGFERQQSGIEDLGALVEQHLLQASRIEAAIQSQQEAVAGSFASLLESSSAGAAELAAGLGELRDHVSQSIGAQADIVRAEFSHLDNRLDMGERSQSTAMGQISEQLTKQFADHTEDLHEGLNTLAEIGGNNARLLKQEMGQLVERLEQHAQQQSECLREAREQSLVATASARNEISAQITRLDEELAGWILAQREQQKVTSAQAQQAAQATQREIAQSLSQLAALVEQKAIDQQALVIESALTARTAADEAGRELRACIGMLGTQLERMKGEQREDLQQSSLQSLEAAGGARREIATCIEQLGTLAAQLERMNCEQREELQRTSQRSLEATLTARRDLADCLQQLEQKLVQQVRDQQDLLLESALSVQQSAQASKTELAAAFEQVGTRLEQSLTADMQAVAEVLDALNVEFRACMPATNEPARDAQAIPALEHQAAVAIETAPELDPIVSESPAPELPAEASTQADIALEYRAHSDTDAPIVWPESQDGTDPWRDPWPGNRS